MAMLRGSDNDQRVQRASVDTGTGTKRVSGDRVDHISRGTFVNYYDDLGISSTRGQADSMRAEDKAFSDEVNIQQGSLDNYMKEYQDGMKQVSDAQGNLPDLQGLLATGWGKFQDSDQFETVNYRGSVYKLPAGTALAQSRPNGTLLTGGSLKPEDDGSLTLTIPTTTFRNDDGDQVKDTGRDLDRQFTSLNNKWKSAFYDQVAPEASQAILDSQGEINTASKTLAGNKTTIDNAQGVLQGSVDQRAASWQDIRDKYTERSSTMKDILGGINFG